MTTLLKTRHASLVLLNFTLLLLLWGCSPTAYVPNLNCMYFKTVSRIPVAEVKINGKRAFFIIDTGASCSILNESVSEHFGFRYGIKRDDHVFGLAGTAQMHRAFNCSVEFGPLDLTHTTFRTKHMDDIVSLIKQHENIEIAGIIGSDVLNHYRVAIDFKRSTISF